MVTLETLIISENIVSPLTVFMELQEITKLTEFGCGEELKSPWNGNNIKVTTISLSLEWILKTKLTKN